MLYCVSKKSLSTLLGHTVLAGGKFMYTGQVSHTRLHSCTSSPETKRDCDYIKAFVNILPHILVQIFPSFSPKIYLKKIHICKKNQAYRYFL